jgi:hypothetical protein
VTSHRATPGYALLGRRLVPPLIAVTAVVGVIALLLFLNSRPTHEGPGPGPAVVATGPASSSATSVTPTPTRTPSRTSVSRSPTPAPPPASEPPATQTAVIARPAVTVLNNSRRTGLAHRVAAQVESRGWPVARVGNFTGRIPESTIYYSAGRHAAAVAFAREFPAVRRVLPRFSGLPGSGLVLVVTRDWPA